METQIIPLVDLKAEYDHLKQDIITAIETVINRGDFILGQDVVEFETEFSKICGSEFAVGCGSGTDALTLALRALDVGPEDEVILPAMTFVATALAVTLCGAKPVLVDVEPETALIDPKRIVAAITKRTKAIIPVHLYGQCADITTIMEIARDHGLFVVEDAAQAHGAHFTDGGWAGSRGDIGCFSFYPSKNLGAYGDGGAIVTNNGAVAKKLLYLRNWGSAKKYYHDTLGLNSRLDTMQAAILRVKLPHLEKQNAARRLAAAAYAKALANLDAVQLTKYNSGCAYHLYVIRVKNREGILKHLNRAGIGAGIHYPFAVHQLGSYHHLGYRVGQFPVSEDWARRCLSLPIYAGLPEFVPEKTAVLLSEALN